MDYHGKKCRDCEHWHKQNRPAPRGQAVDMSQEAQGECRGAPPTVTALPQGNMLIGVSLYPLIKESWDACAQFKPRLTVET